MADGSQRPIAEVNVGDEVVATDPTSGETTTRAVTDVITGDGEKDLVEITISTTADDFSDRTGDDPTTVTITATAEHPFWVAGEDRWVNAGDLKPGYRFETADHHPTTVLAIRTWTQHQRVYNLTVDATHTYYVIAGDTPVLVHNCGGASGTPREANGQPVTLTFRGDSRGPDEIFDTGFKPWGDDMDLMGHATGDNAATSGYVSTSLLPEVARRFGPNVYVIRARGGVDVNLNLRARSPFPEEAEVAIPGGVDPSCILGCTLPNGRWVPNPGFGKR